MGYFFNPFCKKATMRIILFDIDGTLISTDGCGLSAMNHAFYDRFGLENALDGISIAGCTDSSITANVFRRFGMQWGEQDVEALKELYFLYLREELENGERRKNLLPGFPSLLNELRKYSELYLGLLTGNWRQGANIKLSYFGLWDYFAFGAFGDDHSDRNKLLPFALQEMQSRHGSYSLDHRVFVVGDTPKDVQCGRPYDAITIAVATGPYSAECLRKEDPHYVFDDLANVEDILGIIRHHP